MANNAKKVYLVYGGDDMPYEPTYVIASFQSIPVYNILKFQFGCSFFRLCSFSFIPGYFELFIELMSLLKLWLVAFVL